MAQEQAPPGGPDLRQGVAFSELVDGKLVGHAGQEEVLLVRTGSEVFAIGAHCSHYHGPLADGIVVGDSVRCPSPSVAMLRSFVRTKIRSPTCPSPGSRSTC
jgi:hypothetical protein